MQVDIRSPPHLTLVGASCSELSPPPESSCWWKGDPESLRGVSKWLRRTGEVMTGDCASVLKGTTGLWLEGWNHCPSRNNPKHPWVKKCTEDCWLEECMRLYNFQHYWVWELCTGATHLSGGQRTTWTSWFSLVTVWAPGVKLGPLGMTTGTFTHWAASVALALRFFFPISLPN